MIKRFDTYPTGRRLSFAGEYPDLLNQAKFGVLLGTIVAGMLGYMVLNAVLPKVKNK